VKNAALSTISHKVHYCWICWLADWLVGWSLTCLFSTNTAISETRVCWWNNF